MTNVDRPMRQKQGALIAAVVVVLLSGYWWDAGTWGIGGVPRIGFHYDFMHDTGLWAHEGAHALFEADESLANHFQSTCVIF